MGLSPIGCQMEYWVADNMTILYFYLSVDSIETMNKV